MLPYSRGLIIDNTSNYGIVKTETVFGFGPKSDNYVNNTFNTTEPLEWIFSQGNFGSGSVQDPISSQSESRALKDKKTKSTPTTAPPSQRSKKVKKGVKKADKKLKRKAKKKCVFKVLKAKKNRRNKNKGHKKYMIPLILGILAAKSLLIPIALKALAFLSAKGLMMGFFSTVLASVLSLKNMFDHHHYGYQNRKDDSKTQVEIIQVPTKSEDHVYYDEHYKRGDYIPTLLRAVEQEE
ncbi:hypothetical protein ABMA28_009730 [Loxostege sticticalis]|uniref:Uncharacterized protein n=1 Tax=Loxostege sticticalis TaxID=481309 RepID=A0ABD0SB87_LOXSC